MVGLIAKLLMPGEGPGGIIITILLGIAGSLLGGFIDRCADCMGPDRALAFSWRFWVQSSSFFLYRFLFRRTA